MREYNSYPVKLILLHMGNGGSRDGLGNDVRENLEAVRDGRDRGGTGRIEKLRSGGELH